MTSKAVAPLPVVSQQDDLQGEAEPQDGEAVHRDQVLAAWADAWLCGMITAIFVAYKPQWLATWSDHLYLRRPEGEERPGAS